jgi:hypothetical protein
MEFRFKSEFLLDRNRSRSTMIGSLAKHPMRAAVSEPF